MIRFYVERDVVVRDEAKVSVGKVGMDRLLSLAISNDAFNRVLHLSAALPRCIASHDTGDEEPLHLPACIALL